MDDLDLDKALRGEDQPEREDPETTDEATGDDVEDKKQVETPESEDVKSKDDETPSSQDKPKEAEHVPVKALTDERRKRQELERRNQEYERRLKDLESKGSEKPKDFWDDPEGSLRAMRDEMEQARVNDRLNMSEEHAREKYDDVDDRLEEFKEMVQDNPALQAQLQNQRSPWMWLCKQVENHRQHKGFENADEYRESIEKDFNKRVEERAQEIADEREKSNKAKRDSLPGSAADARQAAGRSNGNENANAGPTPIEDILPR